MANNLKYECGCTRTDYLCTEAERLWRKVSNAYWYAQREQSPAAWQSYDRERRAYDKHFQGLYKAERRAKAQVD